MISTQSFAGDYALVALTAGQIYRFSSSVATDHITVSTAVASGAVAFGTRGMDDVPISRAVQASASLPGLFPPVNIGGRWYVDSRRYAPHHEA